MNNAFVNLLLRWLVLALGVVLSTKLVRGIGYDTGTTLAVVVLLLSFFNAILKPLMVLFTLPFIVLSMGLGLWLINAVLLYFVGHLVTGFYVENFGAALLGSLIISVTNIVMNFIMRPPPRPPSGGGRGGRRGKDDGVIDV